MKKKIFTTVFIFMIVLSFFECVPDNEPRNILIELTEEGTPTSIVYKVVENNSGLDTVDSREKKVTDLSGYFKITFGSINANSYQIGNLFNGKKTGEWKLYDENAGERHLKEVTNYNSLGKLHGDFTVYDEEGKIITHHQYKNDRKSGAQREYHYNGKLFKVYNMEKEAYVRDFLSLTPKGDTLYYENFGEEGTGYAKGYNRYGELEWEGKYVNKKAEGIHKEYELQYLNMEKDTARAVVAIEYKPYREGILTGIYKRINYSPEANGNGIDSIIGYYTNYNPSGEWKYYQKGKIVKKVKQ